MSMKTYFNKKFNSQHKNAERKAFIIYHLMRNDITQKQVAEELKITLQSVNQFITGKFKSEKLSNWFLENLKIEV